MNLSYKKEPYDSHWLVAGFSKYFPSGEVIHSYTVTCHEIETGTDVTATTIRDTAIYDNIGIEMVTFGGVDQASYRIVVQVVTVNGLTAELNIDMIVLD